MLLCGTGHRPDKIGGYDSRNPIRVAIRARVHLALEMWAPSKVISGMALGFDQDLASTCITCSVPFIAAVPFQGQESMWPAESQRAYNELLAKADSVVYVSDPGYAAWKMDERNRWMVDQVGSDGLVLACFDGSSGGTRNCVEYAKRMNRRIEYINPDEIVESL